MSDWRDGRGISGAPSSHRAAQRPCCARCRDDRIYVDHGLTGTNRDRPGCALAACHAGVTLVVTKLDRPAMSLPDARDLSG
jgi:hypothetical protein